MVVLMKIAKRNINIDLVKCIAVYSVISVHFFANVGLYKIIIARGDFFTIIFRSLFMICVPLFIITTGYLMKNKELNKKYYYGVIRVLTIYFLDGLLLMLYRHIYYGESFTIRHIINTILSFNISYSWYVEMYLGLFLLIPFINLIYNNLKSNREKVVLIITMLILTSFQGILNIKYLILADWWTRLYPITYYFIGCYLRENKININRGLNIVLFFLSIIISAFVNIHLSIGNTFAFGIFNDWGSILNVIPSVLIFIYIMNINMERLSIKIKRIIVKISELSLGIYLTSAIIDDLLYRNYFQNVNFMSFFGYFKIVPLTFILAISLSIVINIIYKVINKYILDRYVKKIFVN